VAELGPGDNCGIGLLFLADGAERVDLLDRFYSRRDKSTQAEIYRVLMDRHTRVADTLAGRNLQDDDSFPAVFRRYGSAAAAESYFFEHRNTYDFIVSCAVLEHVANLEAALCGMTESLRPGGQMVHFVDLRDHGMFSYRWHELKFLEIPEALYRKMVANSGRPNRYLLSVYKRILADLPVEAEIKVTWLAGVGKIDPALPYDLVPASIRERSLELVRALRNKFAGQFDGYPDEELSVTSFVLCARKAPNAHRGA
jgi:SAM-dependent methyltransferase